MLCNQGAACGFPLGMTRKSKQPTAVPKGNNNLSPGPLHVRDFAPRGADIHGAAEFEPTARQDQMAVLVGTAATKTNRCDEMAFVTRRQRIGSLDPRQLSALKACGELCRREIVGKM